MKNPPVAILLLIFLAAAGCQGNPQVRRVVDSYNAEARRLEDYIYLMEQDIQVLEQENAKLRRQIVGGGGVPSGSGSSTPPRSTSPRGGAAEIGPPEIEGPPAVEMPPSRARPTVPRPLNKPTLPDEPDIGPALEGPARENPATKKVPGPAVVPSDLPAPPRKKTEPEVIDQKVTHLHLNPLHTGGADFDRLPGDDGLSILIEPRNAEDQFVPLAGPVSIVVLDPTKNGDDARIARWDFTQAQATEKIESGVSRGIHLQLPWPTKPPDSQRLEVFVRYETPDGKKLQADREVFVSLPGQFSERWTPRPAERQKKNRPVETNVADKTRDDKTGSGVFGVKVSPPVIRDLAKDSRPPSAASSTVVQEPVVKTPSLLLPPAGLSERSADEKPARPKWSATR